MSSSLCEADDAWRDAASAQQARYLPKSPRSANTRPQRLEQVVLGAVDERDRDVAAAQRTGGEGAAEAAPDDDDPVG